ncbi:MAG: hypothetical protein WBS33_06940, partial [Verrucomicrobiia bacterium]
SATGASQPRAPPPRFSTESFRLSQICFLTVFLAIRANRAFGRKNLPNVFAGSLNRRKLNRRKLLAYLVKHQVFLALAPSSPVVTNNLDKVNKT